MAMFLDAIAVDGTDAFVEIRLPVVAHPSMTLVEARASHKKCVFI